MAGGVFDGDSAIGGAGGAGGSGIGGGYGRSGSSGQGGAIELLGTNGGSSNQVILDDDVLSSNLAQGGAGGAGGSGVGASSLGGPGGQGGEGDGGGLFATFSGSVAIQHSTIIDNQAAGGAGGAGGQGASGDGGSDGPGSGWGGGVYVFPPNPDSTATRTADTVIQNNIADVDPDIAGQLETV